MLIVTYNALSQVSRGSAIPKEMGNSSLIYHIKHVHPEFFKDPDNSESPSPSTSAGSSLKRGADTVQIYNVRTKKERRDMFEFTIPDWIEATNTLDFNSARAQKIHKSIFELFIIDLVPFTEVNKPG